MVFVVSDKNVDKVFRKCIKKLEKNSINPDNILIYATNAGLVKVDTKKYKIYGNPEAKKIFRRNWLAWFGIKFKNNNLNKIYVKNI